MRFNANFWSLAEKEQKVNNWNAHIKRANNERDNYRYRFKYFILGLISLIYKSFVLYTKIRSCIQFAKKSLESNEPTFMGEEIPPCSSDVDVHISWDYAQQIPLPSSSQQVVNWFIFLIKLI